MSNNFGAPSGPPAPLPPPPRTTSSPSPVPPQPPSAEPPTPPPPAASSPGPGSDIDSLLAQLHDEMDLDQSDHFDPAAPLTTPLDASRPERAQAIVIESTGGIDFDPEIPSFDARIVGLLVDLGVLVLFLLPGLLVAIVGGSAPTAVLGLLIGAAGFVAATVLYARHIAASGQWFGNHVAGTTVLDARNGSTLDVGHAGARFAIRFLLSPVFLLGYLVALGNGQRRTFHDTAVGSVVTRPPREAWSLDDENP